jgi:hypothetical protein
MKRNERFEAKRMKRCYFHTASWNHPETGLNLSEYWHENPEFGFVPLCHFIRIALFLASGNGFEFSWILTRKSWFWLRSTMSFYSYRPKMGLNSSEYWHENPEFGFIPLCCFIRIVLFGRFIRYRSILFVPLEPMPKTLYRIILMEINFLKKSHNSLSFWITL